MKLYLAQRVPSCTVVLVQAKVATEFKKKNLT